jgi:hypothetical protein
MASYPGDCPIINMFHPVHTQKLEVSHVAITFDDAELRVELTLATPQQPELVRLWSLEIANTILRRYADAKGATEIDVLCEIPSETSVVSVLQLVGKGNITQESIDEELQPEIAMFVASPETHLRNYCVDPPKYLVMEGVRQMVADIQELKGLLRPVDYDDLKTLMDGVLVAMDRITRHPVAYSKPVDDRNNTLMAESCKDVRLFEQLEQRCRRR